MIKALKVVGKYYVEAVKSQLRQDDTHATGNLADSIDYKIVKGSIDIVNTAYGKAVDEGSSPAKDGSKWVSKEFIQDIMTWAKMKGITPRHGNMQKMANAIARGIKRKGIIQRFGNSGSQIFDRVYNKLEKQIGEDLASAYMKDLKQKLNDL